MARLWRNTDGTREGKYLVQRRDGTVPEWPYFVIGAGDPAAPHALMSYALAAAREGMDPKYVADVQALAWEFEQWREDHGAGDPDASPHRTDDPETVAKMRQAGRMTSPTPPTEEPRDLAKALRESLQRARLAKRKDLDQWAGQTEGTTPA